MNKKALLKKTAAITAAGTMLVSCTGTVWAGAYADAEKANLEAKTAEFAAEWDQDLAEMDLKSASGSGSADISLQLGETGNAMVSMFTGLDVSWIDRLGIRMDFSVADEKEKAVMDLYANEQTIATMLMDIDMAEKIVKAMIPEISDSAFTAPMEMNVDVEGAEDSEQFMKIYMDLLKDPKAVFPDGATAKEILDRYAGIIFDHMEDGATEEGTLAVDGVEEAYTLTEGSADAEAILEMAKEMLTTAKDDEQIAQIVKNLEASSEDLAGLYDQMQSGIDETLSELAENTEAPENVSFSSSLYANADGKAIGRELIMSADGEEVKITWKAPSNGEKTGLELSITSDGETYGIEGSGTITDDVANGVYNLMANGVAMAYANVENLDLKEGKTGTITIGLNENMPDEDTYSAIGTAQITLTFGSDDAESGYVDLAVSYGGSLLGTLRIEGKEGGDVVDLSALDAAANVYDATNDEDMTAFSSELSVDTILANITAAGAPEGFAESVINMIAGGGDDYEDYDYESDYDYEDAEATAEEAAESEPAA